MLQWMGGSRRKVTSSRKSIQNRQKQYFEQRKRQQQVPGLENLSDTQSNQAYCSEEPRSLDILSLTNLATVTQQVYSGKTDEHDVSQKGSHFSQLSTENVVKKVTARYTEDFEKSCLQQGSSTQIKFSADQGFPESHGSSCKIDKFEDQTAACESTSINLVNKTSKQKAAPQNDLSEVSVIDLLGDDGLNSISDGGPVSEPHVAFSVEGLGKVGIGTPAHSPRLYERFLSPPKAPRRKQSLPNCMPSQYDFGVKMDGSQLESRHNTRGLLNDEFSNIKNKSFSFFCTSPVFVNNQNEKFNDEEESFYRVNMKEKPWSEAACGITGNNFLFDEYGVEWMNEPVHTGNYPTFTPKANEYNSFDYDFRDAFSPITRTSFREHRGPDLQGRRVQSNNLMHPTLPWTTRFSSLTKSSLGGE